MSAHLSSAPVRLALAGGTAWLAISLATPAFAASEPVSVQAAVEREVLRRFGGHVTVRIEALRTTVGDTAGLQAVSDPAAKTGKPVRFVLVADGRRKGMAVATVHVVARHVRAARAIPRGEAIAESAIEVIEGEVRDTSFRQLPGSAEVLGRSVRRAVAAGEALTQAVIDIPPLVKNGEEVTVGVTIGQVHVTTTGVASGSGDAGDTVRVIQKGRPGTLRARVMDRGLVEVMP